MKKEPVLEFAQARRELNKLRREALDYRDDDPERAQSCKQQAMVLSLDVIARRSLLPGQACILAAKALLINKIRTRW